MVRRRLLIAVLAFGAVGGYAAGFASLHHHRHSCCDHGDRDRGSWHERGWHERFDHDDSRDPRDPRDMREGDPR